MKANPGGQLAPDEIVGRDQFINQLWRVLERQSLVLTAERRIGKTSVMNKMRAENDKNKLIIYRDLEGLQTSLEFVEAVFHDVEDHLSRLTRNAERARRFLRDFEDGSIKGFKLPKAVAPHWKDFLNSTIEDLVGNQDGQVIFFWDELPLMLHKIKISEGERAAMEVLDTLRALRQTHTQLRMVFTGSVGLHNVLASLRRAGHANAPVNDMQTVEVPTLSPEDGCDLAQKLLAGENIQTDDVEATAGLVAQLVDGNAFFIHHVIDQMVVQYQGRIVSAEVEKLIDACIRDPQDAWHLKYYQDRIRTYYAEDEQDFAFHLLDVLAVSEQALSFDDTFNQLKARLDTEDKNKVREVLTVLQKDHYVFMNEAGHYCFRFSLIQRSWRLHRGLI